MVRSSEDTLYVPLTTFPFYLPSISLLLFPLSLYLIIIPNRNSMNLWTRRRHSLCRRTWRCQTTLVCHLLTYLFHLDTFLALSLSPSPSPSPSPSLSIFNSVFILFYFVFILYYLFILLFQRDVIGRKPEYEGAIISHRLIHLLRRGM